MKHGSVLFSVIVPQAKIFIFVDDKHLYNKKNNNIIKLKTAVMDSYKQYVYKSLHTRQDIPCIKVKQFLYRPGQALRFPGG
jgi:hypothetical protein